MKPSVVDYCKSGTGKRTALILIGVMSLLFLIVRYNLIEIGRADAERQLRQVLDSIEADTRALYAEKSATVRFLAQLPPIQGIVRTGKNLEFDEPGNSSFRDWHNRLSQIFQAYLESNPDIVGMRYVGIAQGGRELVRVLRSGQTVRVVPEDELASRIDRTYFQKAIELPHQGISVSSLEWNRTERLKKMPTLSFSTPVYDRNERVFGFVTLQVDAREYLERISQKSREIGVVCANDRGTIFLEPDAEIFPPSSPSWQDDLSHLELRSASTPMSELPSPDGDAYLFLGRKVAYSKESERALSFAAMLPLSAVLAREQGHLWRVGCTMAGLSALVFLMGFLRWSRSRQHLEHQRRQARLGALIGGSRDAIVQMKHGRRVVGWNAAAEELFGYSASEILDRNLVQTLCLSSSERAAPLPDFKESGKWELRATTKKRKRLEVIATVAGKVDPLDRSDDTAVIFRDVTEERAAAENIKSLNRGLEAFAQETSAELAETAAFIEAILRNAGTAIIATDAHGTITVANPAAQKMLGYSANEMIGVMTPLDYLDPDELEQKAAALEKAIGKVVEPPWALFTIQLDRFEVLEDDYTYLRKDGKRLPVHLTLTKIIGRRGETAGYLGVSADRTATLERELAMERAWEEAERANRAKSRFVAHVSHEIRTPMNAIWGMLQLLQASRMTRLQQRQVSQASAASEVLLSILNDVLDLSKIEAGKLELFRVPFFLHGVLEHLANLANSTLGTKDVDLYFSIDEEVPDSIVGDSLRLQQVLVNLLSNAVKFTDRGHIGLTISVKQESDECVYLCFEVADTGIGMAPSQLRKVFQDFVQADKCTTHRYGGTGLGLSISKQLVEMMGGRLHAESLLNEGTTFSFTVPFGKSNREAGISRCLQKASSFRALIVEQNRSLHPHLKSLITFLGWHCELTSSADEARLLLVRESFDVLLVDLRSASRRFLETARGLSGPEMTILLVAQSMASQLGDLVHHCDDVLMKPLTVSKVQETVLLLRSDESASSSLEAPKPLTGLSLLVVDDVVINLEVARSILSEAGAKVRTAKGGVEAVLEMSKGSRFDAVLMDVQMSDLNGIETARRLQELPMTVPPIIAFTAGVTPSERQACLRAGMVDCITKPFRIETLSAVLRNHIRPQPLPSESHASTEACRDDPIASEQHPLALFRYADAVHHCGGNHEVLVTEMRRFCRDSSTVGRTIETLVTSGEMGAASQASHGLKGIAGMLGAGRLSEKAGQLEVALRAGKSSDELLPISRELTWLATETIEQMEDYLDSGASHPEARRSPHD